MTEGQKAIWVYLGRRVDDKGRIRTAWRDENGEELWYGEQKHFVVGRAYEVTVDRSQGGARRGAPKWVDRPDCDAPADERLLLEAKDADAYATVQRTRAEARLAKEKVPLLSAEAKAAIRKCQSWAELQVLVRAVEREVVTSWK